jgi:hypothetical protein
MQIPNDLSVDLHCFRCGYDLRAHPPDGKCPECGASVAQSREVAAIPLRPAWRDSDPRWRRRMLTGAWILLLLPLMDVLTAFGWASSIPVPAVFEIRGAVRTLDDTLLSYPSVYQPLIFCIGVVLLFSKERGRRRDRLDWTRRWGVLSSYVTLLLSAASVLFICSLVGVGISALFISMPLKYQTHPRAIQFLIDLSTTWLRYGPRPKYSSGLVRVAFSSIAVLLACIPLFNALRSSGPRRLAAILLSPLALFSLLNLAQVGFYFLSAGWLSTDVFYYEVYFRPDSIVKAIVEPGALIPSGSMFIPFLMEAIKWCIVLAIAVWLTIAQLAAWRQRKKRRAT